MRCPYNRWGVFSDTLTRIARRNDRMIHAKSLTIEMVGCTVTAALWQSSEKRADDVMIGCSFLGSVVRLPERFSGKSGLQPTNVNSG